MVLKHMPAGFHEALQLLCQALSLTGITPPAWLHNHTILLYKKGDPATLDNYRPITLANAPSTYGISPKCHQHPQLSIHRP